MAETDSGEKTEKATPERLKKAYKEGQIQRSQDIIAWVTVGGSVAGLGMTLSSLPAGLNGLFLQAVDAGASADPQRINELGFSVPNVIVMSIAPLLAATFIAAIIGNVAQGGVHFKKLKFSTKSFNLPKGIKQKFGKQSAWQGLKAVMKTAVIGAVLYYCIQAEIPNLLVAGGLTLPELIASASSNMNTLLWAAVAGGLTLGAIDYVVVRKRNRKHTHMTKQEMRDDYKRTEGDPQIKQRRRSAHMALTRNRMLSAVADADAVVVNPVHVAIALKYTAGKGAPRVVAKGRGFTARAIRERALEHKVQIVKDIPLARALHNTCKVGDEVPQELFLAVAQVLAFVAHLKSESRSLASVRRLPKPASVPAELAEKNMHQWKED